jgi:hypothetical protein
MYNTIAMAGQYGRRLFFWALAALFFLTTVLVVFYAQGYRWSYERGIFIYGGSITLKSNPRTVSITLDGKPVSQKKVSFINSSYHIDGIKPGEYLLEVSAPDFKSWSKKITIRSGVSTEFWNVLLVRNEYPKVNYDIRANKKFFVSPKNDYIAYFEDNESGLSVNIVDVKSAEKNIIFSSPDFHFTSDEKENIEWAPHAHALIIPAIKKENGSKNYIVAFINLKEPLNLNEVTGKQDTKNVRWDPFKKNVIYYLSDGNLYRWEIEDTGEPQLFAQNVVAFDFAVGKIYYLQLPGGLVYETVNLENPESKQITTSPPTDLSNTNYKIIVYDSERIVLINYEIRKLYVWNKGKNGQYFRELAGNVRGIQFSDDGKKLLFWNEWEIYVYFLRDWEAQPERLENEILEVTRYSGELQNVQWSKDYEHVIFSAGDKIRITELDRRDFCNTLDIADLSQADMSVVSDFSENKLFFTDKTENSESFSLFGIDFPEKEGILGL